MLRLRLKILVMLALSCPCLLAGQLDDCVHAEVTSEDPAAVTTPPLDDPIPSVTKESRRVIALKTNLLYDAIATPSNGIEVSIGRHFSVGADWMYAWWGNHDKNRHWRIYGGDVNARYYFGNRNGRPLSGHHIGVYGQVLVFQIAFGGKGYITGIPGENLWGKPYLGGAWSTDTPCASEGGSTSTSRSDSAT